MDVFGVFIIVVAIVFMFVNVYITHIELKKISKHNQIKKEEKLSNSVDEWV